MTQGSPLEGTETLGSRHEGMVTRESPGIIMAHRDMKRIKKIGRLETPLSSSVIAKRLIVVSTNSVSAFIGLYEVTGLDTSNQNFQRRIVNIFLPINFNICFGCSKEPSH